MRICLCILGGTEHCRYCQNNNSDYFTNWNRKEDTVKPKPSWRIYTTTE